MNKLIACVTGASGIIGSKITTILLSQGYTVRVLSRKANFAASNVEFFRGDINDETVLNLFMQNAQLFFHCAAELKDKSRMWSINVTGTERILKYAELHGIKYFCYLSTVGVIGKTDYKLPDELTPCAPQNVYERSKWAAEQLVACGIKGCKVVILRPTDVIDERNPGILMLPRRRAFKDFCKVFVKGGECAHIVHAEDVAHAAVYFISYPLDFPQCYIISSDQAPLNTLSGVWALYRAYSTGRSTDNVRPVPHLPLFVPYFLRRIIRRSGNMGDVRYSSEKLLKTGFNFALGLEGVVLQLASTPKSESIETSCAKPIILVFIGHYLPGFKAGGIVRVLVNTIDHLSDEFEFRIITRDRDLGDDKPYAGIKLNQWQQVGNAAVYYLPPELQTVKNILNLIVNTPHNMLFLNSFFDPLTIKVLLSRKFRNVNFKPVIVAPWGEFAWASFKQKYPKKLVFVQLARLFGLYNNVTWRASSEYEKLDIIKVMKIKSKDIHIIGDLPIKNILDVILTKASKSTSDTKDLKIVFLSRISREKNLDYALRVLSKVKAKVVFDIYGPAENSNYWKKCQELIRELPANVLVNYLGAVNGNQVVNVFSNYDLFLFPTGGEAYGHVIAESLVSGTPVLISTETPWRNLESDGLGWDIDLTRIDLFVEIIEKLALLSPDEHMRKRVEIKTKIRERLLGPDIWESNRQLFNVQMLS